jgi:tetratricopeptide (TPR) repeat protein
MVYDGKGERERALEEYEVALKLSKASSHPELGEEGMGTAAIIGNMGRVHKKMKNYDKALELLKRSLEMKEKAGAEKVHILATMGQIASTYKGMGRYSEAVEWNEMCLAGEEAELGKNHPSTLISVNNLAFACENAGDLDRAVELYERCLAGREEGGDDDRARRTAENLGDALKEGGAKFAAKLAALKQKYPAIVESCGTTEEIIAILEPRLKAEEEEGEGTVGTMNSLANAYRDAGNFDRAVELKERCLKAAEEEGKPMDANSWGVPGLGLTLKMGGAKFDAKFDALEKKYPGMSEHEDVKGCVRG